MGVSRDKDYKYRELIYVLKNIVKEFIKDFHKGMTQEYNKTTALVNKF